MNPPLCNSAKRIVTEICKLPWLSRNYGKGFWRNRPCEEKNPKDKTKTWMFQDKLVIHRFGNAKVTPQLQHNESSGRTSRKIRNTGASMRARLSLLETHIQMTLKTRTINLWRKNFEECPIFSQSQVTEYFCFSFYFFTPDVVKSETTAWPFTIIPG